jgi:hypothetical protein
MHHRKIILVIGLLTVMIIFMVRCIGKNSYTGDDPRGGQYAGSKTCESCHKDIMHSFLHTGHNNTSAKVSPAELKKFIDSSNNMLYYQDSGIVRVEEKESNFFQSHIDNGKTVRSEKLDIAFGSAEKAQTYAYWKDDQLFQLPLTYFASLHSWTNSPGFPMRKPYFDRVILSRCFECHASYITKTNFQSGPLQTGEKLNAASIIFGSDCERCHGPAAEHVQFHQENPTVKDSHFITSIKSLTRQQKLDLCGSCHSGNDLDVQRSLFGFRPGDTLSDFYFPRFGSGSDPDVHGKQMQLLQSSKCFQQSTMTCMTCHDTHKQEVNKQDVFISKCMTCHQTSLHAVQMKIADKNCIDCHMPLQASRSLDFNNGKEAKSIPYMLRTHRIAIYSEIK